MALFTLENISAFAPDSSSLSAAKGLTKVNDWIFLAHDNPTTPSALWGEIKGSGKTPYQTRIDLNEPAFKCSCPSRKFPCKHGLALLIVHLQNNSHFQTLPQPTWVSEWLTTRNIKANKPSSSAQAEQKAAELACLSELEREAIALKEAKKHAKAQAAKADKAAIGLAQCSLFLHDVLRQGFSQLNISPADFSGLAAQLVDAQLPGLARLMRDADTLQYSGAGWEIRLAQQFGTLELILAAHRQRDALTPELQADLDQVLGYTVSQEAVLQSNNAVKLAGIWQLLGHHVSHDTSIISRRSWWLHLETQQTAMVLAFAAGNQALPLALPVGLYYQAQMTYYPSAYPQRALLDSNPERLNKLPAHTTPQGVSIAQGLAQYAHALAQLPWLPRLPLVLSGVSLHRNLTDSIIETWHIVQISNATMTENLLALPITRNFNCAWDWLARTGGKAATVAGEWDGTTFTPLTLWHNTNNIADGTVTCFSLQEMAA